MPEEDDEENYTWGITHEMQMLITTVKAMPPWNRTQNDPKAKKLIREFMVKYSGDNIPEMVKDVLTDEEIRSLVENEQVSQEVIDSLHLKEEPVHDPWQRRLI